MSGILIYDYPGLSKLLESARHLALPPSLTRVHKRSLTARHVSHCDVTNNRYGIEDSIQSVPTIGANETNGSTYMHLGLAGASQAIT